jgi:hypothetical protein
VLISSAEQEACLGSHVDMVSNLDSVSIFFYSLFNNYLATSAKRLADSTINVHRNYNDFCIALGVPLGCCLDVSELNHVCLLNVTGTVHLSALGCAC